MVMLHYLKRLLASIFISIKPIKILDSSVTKEIEDRHNDIHKELSWFARNNNLMEEYHGFPPMVSSSNANDWDTDLEYAVSIASINESNSEPTFDDDVDLLKSNPDYAKPNYGITKNTDYKNHNNV